MAPDRAIEDEFGIPLSIYGDTLVVGAYCDDSAARPDSGSAYVFVRSGTSWSDQQKLPPSTPAPLYALPPCPSGGYTGRPGAPARQQLGDVPGGGQVPGAERRARGGGDSDRGEPEQPRKPAGVPGGPSDTGDQRRELRGGQDEAGNGIVLLGTDGQIAEQCGMPAGSAGRTHFVLDVFGYFR